VISRWAGEGNIEKLFLRCTMWCGRDQCGPQDHHGCRSQQLEGIIAVWGGGGGLQGFHPHCSALLHKQRLLCHCLTTACIIYDKNDKILYFPSCTVANILHITIMEYNLHEIFVMWRVKQRGITDAQKMVPRLERLRTGVRAEQSINNLVC
jgi:hypothetical protein